MAERVPATRSDPWLDLWNSMNNTTGRFGWLLVVVAVVVATMLRFSGIEARSVWGDEIVTLTVSMGNSWYPWHGEESELSYSASYYRDRVALAPTYFSQRLVSLLNVNDQMPPFYYVLVNLWLHAFGTSATALRSLSLLASVASIPLLYLLGRALSSHRVGTYAAWIFALAPFQVAFALYNRPYALLGFFAIFSTLAAVHLARGKTGPWLVVYAIAITLGLYTHYLYVWNIVFHLILITYCQRRDRRFLSRFGLACAAAAAAFMFWVPTFMAQIQWSSQLEHQSWFYWYSGQGSVSSVIGSLRRNLALLLAPGRITAICAPGSGSDCRIEDALTVLALAVPVLIAGFCAWRLTQHVRRSASDGGTLPDAWATCGLWAACAFLGPVVMDLALDSHLVSSHRYFINASGPVYLAVALAVAGTTGRWFRWSVGAAYLLFLFAGSMLYLRGSANELIYEMGVRDLARHIDERSDDGRDLILVLDPGPNPMDYSYYLRSNPTFARVKIPDRHLAVPAIPAQLLAVTNANRPVRIWYLDDRGPESQAQSAVLGWLRTHYTEIEAREFRNIGVVVFSPLADQR